MAKITWFQSAVSKIWRKYEGNRVLRKEIMWIDLEKSNKYVLKIDNGNQNMKKWVESEDNICDRSVSHQSIKIRLTGIKAKRK